MSPYLLLSNQNSAIQDLPQTAADVRFDNVAHWPLHSNNQGRRSFCAKGRAKKSTGLPPKKGRLEKGVRKDNGATLHTTIKILIS